MYKSNFQIILVNYVWVWTQNNLLFDVLSDSLINVLIIVLISNYYQSTLHLNNTEFFSMYKIKFILILKDICIYEFY